ncbi:hypothetical protein JTE90_023453 [Oedothorax gibbosus]|uniref:Uncharacterized protein n=1 Tax=Oedothorax gibbosus TaxID=931172 RepID=A0AAV6TRY9_9ARAC|nr:hypothetical protein JTE90_023453 [Oedothorax gibbosus]
MPAITVCNPNGIVPVVFCDLQGICLSYKMMMFGDNGRTCDYFLEYCDKTGRPIQDFKALAYQSFFIQRCLNQTIIRRLRVPLEDFFQCRIVGDGPDRSCNISNVQVGSFYTKGKSPPSFCYTIFSHWGNPGAEIEKIKRSEKIVIEAYIDYSYQNKSAPIDLVQLPKHNGVANPALQLAIHSRHLMVSPYAVGNGFFGGSNYTITLKQEEKHLLESPYQTNCTDYMAEWKAKNGKAPLNQLMVVEECKLKAYLEEFDCVPKVVDYPHNETLCRTLSEQAREQRKSFAVVQDSVCFENASLNQIKINEIEEKCSSLINKYNQPCHSLGYDMQVEENFVYSKKILEYLHSNKTSSILLKTKGYNCTLDKMYTRRCQTIRIVIDFENFKINNVTYNPKYESLELVSVIGGYMGMYLGISLLAIYDFAEILARKLYSTLKRRQKRRNKVKDVNHSQISSRCHTKLVRIVRQRHQSGVFRKRPAKIHPHRRY